MKRDVGSFQLAESWAQSRAGARAGSGFRFQTAATTAAAVLCWSGRLKGNAIIPEGLDDFSIESDGATVHVQVKSKVSNRSLFTNADLAAFLMRAITAKAESDHEARQIVLLDRAFGGQRHDDWEKSLSSDAALSLALGSALRGRIHNDAMLASLLAKSTLITLDSPISIAAKEISAKKEVTQAAALCCVYKLLRFIGDRTDANATATYDRRAKVTVGEIEREIDSVLGLIDWTSLDAVTRKGVIEHIDFGTAVSEPDYYRGVATQPGHVAAGLPYPRESLTNVILDALFRRFRVLVVGPSGSGKSAAALMAAFEVRHACRWMQLKQLSAADREDLRRFVVAQAPSSDSPLVVYVDNAGGGLEAWEAAVELSVSIPFVFVVACAREEDLAILAGRELFEEIRPALDNQFAERMWQQLKKEDATSWASWQEPYERCKGLLLEYAHILTQGRRLRDVILDQIALRLREKRDSEFEVLRLVSAAASLGACVSSSALAKHLGLSVADCARALGRLIDEHLVRRVGDDEISGLHELRSQCIFDVCTALSPGSAADARQQALSIVSAGGLRALIAAAARLGQLAEPLVVGAMARRLKADPNPAILIGALEGLKICTLDRDAETFKLLADRHNVSPRHYFLAVIVMLLPKQNVGGAFRALEAIRDEFLSTRSRDFRRDLLEAFEAQQLRAVIKNIGSFGQAFALLRSLAELDLGHLVPELSGLGEHFKAAPLEEVAAAAIVAEEISKELVHKIVDDLGGAERLLTRLWSETPWALRPILSAESGGTMLEANLLAVDGPLVDARDTTVFEYAGRALALAPTAQRITSQPVTITGRPLVINGASRGLKSFDRENNSSKARTVWLRLLLHAVALRYAAPSTTEVMKRRKEGLEIASEMFAGHAERRCRRKKLAAQEDAKLRAFALLEDVLPTLPMEKPEIALAVDTLRIDLTDAAGELLTEVVSACRRLYDDTIDGFLLAVDMDRIRKAVVTCRSDTRWTYVGGAPVEALERIEQVARMLTEIFLATSRQFGVAPSLVTMPSSQIWARGTGLEKSFHRAVLQGRTKVASATPRLSELFSEEGIKVHVQSSATTSSVISRWPQEDICLLVECQSQEGFFVWLARHVEALKLESKRLGTLAVAPMILGNVITHNAVCVLPSIGALPATDFAAQWHSVLAWPCFISETLKAFEEAFGNTLHLGAIQELMAGKELLAVESAYLENCRKNADVALGVLEHALFEQPDIDFA